MSTNNKVHWRMVSDIKSIIAECNGVLFGGAVRDSVIHDYFAIKFYTESDNMEYDNKNAHPESWPWRCLSPCDIDTVMSTENIEVFKKALKKKDYTIVPIIVNSAMPRQYGNFFDSGLLHNKYIIKVKMHPLITEFTNANMKIPCVHIDVIHKGGLEAEKAFPLGDIDFECNSLIITPRNTIELPDKTKQNPITKLKKLQSIIDDIQNFIARPVKPELYRFQKMIAKGFTVIDRHLIVYPKSVSVKTEEHCIVCFADFSTAELQVKNKCCNARYHKECYALSVKRSTTEYDNIRACIMCRQALPFTDSQRSPIELICENE